MRNFDLGWTICLTQEVILLVKTFAFAWLLQIGKLGKKQEQVTSVKIYQNSSREGFMTSQ